MVVIIILLVMLYFLLVISAIVRLVNVWNYIDLGKRFLYLVMVFFFPFLGSIVILLTATKDPFIMQQRELQNAQYAEFQRKQATKLKMQHKSVI